MKLPTMKNWCKSPYFAKDLKLIRESTKELIRELTKEFKLFLNKRKNDDFKYESLNYILYLTIYKQI